MCTDVELMYVGGSVCVRTTCVRATDVQVHMEARRGSGSRSCKPCGLFNRDAGKLIGPFQEHYMFLTTEPSFWPFECLT